MADTDSWCKSKWNYDRSLRKLPEVAGVSSWSCSILRKVTAVGKDMPGGPLAQVKGAKAVSGHFRIVLICLWRDRKAVGRRAGCLRQELVAFELHRDRALGAGGGRAHTHNFATAAHPHVLGQGDLGRHDQRELDGLAHVQGKVAVEKRSARAQVLRETTSFVIGTPWPAHRNRKMKIEPLSRASLKLNLGGSHSSLRTPPCGARRRMRFGRELNPQDCLVFATARPYP